MTVGVSHTFGGSVVVVDMETGKRWDMTPEMAEDGATKCVNAAGYMTASALIVINAMEDRQFRFAGDQGDMLKMAEDLRKNAKQAREIVKDQP